MQSPRSLPTPSTSPTTMQRFAYQPVAASDSNQPSTPTHKRVHFKRTILPLLAGALLAVVIVLAYHHSPSVSKYLTTWRSVTDESPAVGDWRTPVSDSTATVPVDRQADGGWTDRFKTITQNVHKYGPTAEVLFVGDSITHNWETGPGADLWREHYVKRYGAVNAGVGGDQTQHVIWRLENGNLPDGVFNSHLLRAVVVMIGTNNANADSHSPNQIVNGTARIIQQLHAALPAATIVLLSTFPRDSWTLFRTNEVANNQTQQFIDDKGIVQWFDLRQPWLKQKWSDVEQQIDAEHSEDKSVPVYYELMPDGLHPNADGYSIWVDQLQPLLDEILGDRSTTEQVSAQYDDIKDMPLPIEVEYRGNKLVYLDPWD